MAERHIGPPQLDAKDHPHVHCLVPGGGLAVKGRHWVRVGLVSFRPCECSRAWFGRLFLEKLHYNVHTGHRIHIHRTIRAQDGGSGKTSTREEPAGPACRKHEAAVRALSASC
jgi:hypothetical protein